MTAWTLFLDRDGVLNKKIENGYVTAPDELVVLPGVLEAMSTISEFFSHIFIVTNQRGIAKGLYSIHDLNKIHKKLVSQISEGGGRIDRIYFCPHDKEQCNCRKPSIGMALQAMGDFPVISLNHSIMVGDSSSDIQFGQALKMKTVLIAKDQDQIEPSPDYVFKSLLDFSKNIKSMTQN